MISCLITLHEDIENIHQLFLAELPNAESRRAGYTVKKKKDCLEIEIRAKDVTSLKAFTISVLKILETYSRIKNGN